MKKISIGTDITSVKRFEEWSKFNKTILLRIFSNIELMECWDNKKKLYNPEKLAARFAVKESFYKAFSSLFFVHKKITNQVGILSLARHISLAKDDNFIPYLVIDWKNICLLCDLVIDSKNIESSVSLSHEKDIAIASVILLLNT